MTTQELVDLLSYLTTLRQPVSIVGQYQVVGPLDEPNGTSPIDPGSALDPHTPVDDGRGHQLSWRRLGTNAEGQADLAMVGSSMRCRPSMCLFPLIHRRSQRARLVIDTPLEVSAWFNGKSVAFSPAEQTSRRATHCARSNCPEDRASC